MHNKTKKGVKTQQHITTTQGPASSPSAQQQALGCSSRNKEQESLTRSSEEYDFLSFFSLPLYPAQILPKSLLWDLHSARHKPYSQMSQNISVSQHHSLFALNFPRNASAILQLSPFSLHA